MGIIYIPPARQSGRVRMTLTFGKSVLVKKFVFRFSLQLLLETLLTPIVSKSRSSGAHNARRPHVKCALLLSALTTTGMQ